MKKIKWIEISDVESRSAGRARFETLSSLLSESGVENEIVLQETTGEDLQTSLKSAMAGFDQIRISGSIGSNVLEHFDNVPLSSKQIGAADALVKADGKWWPRNFLFDGILRAVVSDVKKLNLSGGVFVFGATTEARAAIGAFARLGYRKFSISDPREDIGQTFVEQLKKTHFEVQFQFIPRHMITQLPSVHSAGINTLVRGHDDGALEELFYFNFLEPMGVWLDLALFPLNEALSEEARAVGAFVESGISVAAHTDALWVEACFPSFALDREAYCERLSSALRSIK